MIKSLRAFIIVLLILTIVFVFLYLCLACGKLKIDILPYLAQATLAGAVTFWGLYCTIIRQDQQQQCEQLEKDCPCFVIKQHTILGSEHAKDEAKFALTNDSSARIAKLLFINCRKNEVLNLKVYTPLKGQCQPLEQNTPEPFWLTIDETQYQSILLKFDNIYGRHYTQTINYIFKNNKLVFEIQQPTEEENEKAK